MTDNDSGDSERRECINDGCKADATRVVTRYGGVAPVCDDHAEKRLEHPHVVDQTAYFKGERDEAKPEPSPNDPLPPEYRQRSVAPDTDRDDDQELEPDGGRETCPECDLELIGGKCLTRSCPNRDPIVDRVLGDGEGGESA